MIDRQTSLLRIVPRAVARRSLTFERGKRRAQRERLDESGESVRQLIPDLVPDHSAERVRSCGALPTAELFQIEIVAGWTRERW